MSCPRLTFFVELDQHKVEQLLAPKRVELLAQSNSAIAMAMLDLSPGRARTVKALNDAGVPVTAWLVLEKADGYWLTADNPEVAHQRYAAVKDWAGQHGLVFDAIGLDIETPHQDAMSIVREGADALLRLVLRRRPMRVVQLANLWYEELVKQVRRDGMRVETYQFPPIIDERRVHSTLLQRVFGMVNVRPDREVLMLYRSMVPGPAGAAMIDVYGAEADAIAVGITGGGVPFLEQIVTKLSLRKLLVELRRARRYTQHLYVFSLEGCVSGGYLEALCRADLELDIDPSAYAPLGQAARAGLRAVLRTEKLLDRVVHPFHPR